MTMQIKIWYAFTFLLTMILLQLHQKIKFGRKEGGVEITSDGPHHAVYPFVQLQANFSLFADIYIYFHTHIFLSFQHFFSFIKFKGKHVRDAYTYFWHKGCQWSVTVMRHMYILPWSEVTTSSSSSSSSL